ETTTAPAVAPPLDPSALPGAKRGALPKQLAPQLAKPADHAPVGDDWLHEIKFDGYRILAHVRDGAAILRSRTGLDWSDKFPELARTLAQLPVSSALLDGEVVHLADSGVSSFGALQDDI